ncbi:MAG: hypothetical protein ACOYD6_00840, partial [Limnochordia bacterium]
MLQKTKQKRCWSLNRLSLKAKVLLPVIVALFILGGTIFFVSQYIIAHQAKNMALHKVHSDLALMYELIDRELPGPWRKEGSLLYKGDV